MTDLNQKIMQYVQLRDYLDEAKKEFNNSMDRVKQAMAKLESEFAVHLNDSGSNSANTDAGTIYKIERTSATVKDRDEFFKFAIKNRKFEAMDIRANKKIIKELLDEGVEVPGVKFTASTQIGIRRGKES
jgi:uncharacterized protein with GYD domain